MAYKALYRTYRPDHFNDVAGQKHIVQTLQNAVNQNKIAHAYLFCGPRGTGKTSIAKIFAKAVNCEADDHRPCLKCENCESIALGNHPDIVEIDAASNNGVEEVRDLIEKVKYAPIKGKYKVYIIDEVHMMSTGAFNALLKTIEEPPSHVIFILATTEPQKVIPTIISRCQRFDFTKVSSEEIIARIKKILKSESIVSEDEVIRIISILADGGMRDALSILDQCIAYAQNNLEVHHINEIYGITTITEKLTLLKSVYHRSGSDLLNQINLMIEKGIDIKRLTMDLIEILKESLIYDYTKDITLLKLLSLEEVREVKLNKSSTERLNMIDILMETYDKYRSAASVSSYFEVCLLKMMNLTEVEVVKDEVKEEIKGIESVNKIINVSRETFSDISLNESDQIPFFDEIEDETYQTIIVEEEEKEVIKDDKVNKSSQPLNDENVLSLLVGADKELRKEDMQYWKTIPEYLTEIEWVKDASLLKATDIMASGDRYLIISVENQSIANQINEKDSNDQFLSFMNKILKKKKKVFAVTNEQRKRVTENFVSRMKNNDLPQPILFEEFQEDQKKIEDMSNEEIVLDLFGKDNIIITEE